jgi:hypothetical protein
VRKLKDGLSKRCACGLRQWTKCAHPWHFAFCHGLTAEGRKARYRFSLHRFARKPPRYFMSRTEAAALADQIRTDVRAGRITLEGSDTQQVRDVASSAELTLKDVADLYLRTYARITTRRQHAVRQFEIHVRMLCASRGQGPRETLVNLGEKPFAAISRADLDAAFCRPCSCSRVGSYGRSRSSPPACFGQEGV